MCSSRNVPEGMPEEAKAGAEGYRQREPKTLLRKGLARKARPVARGKTIRDPRELEKAGEARPNRLS